MLSWSGTDCAAIVTERLKRKSELVIAEALSSAGITFEYERPLSLGGTVRFPDFTIDDETSGRLIFWERLGMLELTGYRLSWEKKLSWYRAQGVLPANEGDGVNGTLVTTTESTKEGFDAASVQAVIRRYLSG